MSRAQSLRRALLRWDRLVAAGAAALPTLVLSLLGFLWLGERGLLPQFLGACIALALAVWLLRWWSRRPRRAAAAPPELAAGLSVSADPDWGPAETAVFQRVRAGIEARTAEPCPWESLPDLALAVVREVAEGLGGRGVLDFTVPEALLLVERTVSRYRARMRAQLPFVDSVSLGTMSWLWTRRDWLGRGWRLANLGYRAGRLVRNPPLGVMRELEQLVSGGNSSWLGGQMMGVAQAVLLEEVAFAAVELYSGRLKFSDAELLELGLAAAERDRGRLARPDAPLRILVLGQTSSGKSTLVNALLGDDRAETDAAATTPGFVAHEGEIEGLPCFWVDSRGLDGGAEGLEALLAEMREADMILWTLRANRPGRAPDQALLRRFRAAFDAEPERQRPEIIAVATCVDQLVPGWPYPENLLPPAAQETVAGVVLAIAADMDGLRPIPVCAVSPEWNLEALRTALAAGLARAIKVQRNRRRLVDAARSAGLLQEIGRGGQGLIAGAGEIGGRLLRRVLPAPGGGSGEG